MVDSLKLVGNRSCANDTETTTYPRLEFEESVRADIAPKTNDTAGVTLLLSSQTQLCGYRNLNIKSNKGFNEEFVFDLDSSYHGFYAHDPELSPDPDYQTISRLGLHKLPANLLISYGCPSPWSDIYKLDLLFSQDRVRVTYEFYKDDLNQETALSIHKGAELLDQAVEKFDGYQSNEDWNDEPGIVSRYYTAPLNLIKTRIWSTP